MTDYSDLYGKQPVNFNDINSGILADAEVSFYYGEAGSDNTILWQLVDADVGKYTKAIIGVSLPGNINNHTFQNREKFTLQVNGMGGYWISPYNAVGQSALQGDVSPDQNERSGSTRIVLGNNKIDDQRFVFKFDKVQMLNGAIVGRIINGTGENIQTVGQINNTKDVGLIGKGADMLTFIKIHKAGPAYVQYILEQNKNLQKKCCFNSYYNDTTKFPGLQQACTNIGYTPSGASCQSMKSGLCNNPPDWASDTMKNECGGVSNGTTPSVGTPQPTQPVQLITVPSQITTASPSFWDKWKNWILAIGALLSLFAIGIGIWFTTKPKAIEGTKKSVNVSPGGAPPTIVASETQFAGDNF